MTNNGEGSWLFRTGADDSAKLRIAEIQQVSNMTRTTSAQVKQYAPRLHAQLLDRKTARLVALRRDATSSQARFLVSPPGPKYAIVLGRRSVTEELLRPANQLASASPSLSGSSCDAHLHCPQFRLTLNPVERKSKSSDDKRRQHHDPFSRVRSDHERRLCKNGRHEPGYVLGIPSSRFGFCRSCAP